MDSPNTQQQLQSQLQQQQQQQPSQTQCSSKNIKNLSIKEFFTTRLMRARSFEGGSNSPKDETSNWFDEFKARMTKRSQANSNKHPTSGSNNTTLEENNDADSTDSNEVSVKFTIPEKKSKHQHKDDQTSSLVKDDCDIGLGGLITSGEESLADSLQQQLNDISQSRKDTSDRSKIKTSILRPRKIQRISCIESPDFDTASINTIFNRRDSRYDAIGRKPKKSIFSKILTLTKWVISYLLPFNYNLPWKLICLLNSSLVIIVIGLASKTNPDLKALSFFNGFISGLLVAGLCFVILILSLLVQILPPSKESLDSAPIVASKVINDRPRKNEPSVIGNTEKIKESQSEPKDEDFSQFEVLENSSTTEFDKNLLEDDDYKGWMIEFIGDYELRNKSDIKLKLVFVKVENRILYLCKPKNSHDAESTLFPVFVQQRIYDLNLAKKFSANLLLPRNVRNRQKWVWSKKYPIRLEFQVEEGEQSSKSQEAMKTIQLTLFAKSCREKEEWFRRFKRIVEENRLAHGNQSNKRPSVQSDDLEKNDDGVLGSLKNYQDRGSPSPSPSVKRDGVQTSRTSTMLNETAKRAMQEENKSSESVSNLSRTKSCEQLSGEQISTATAETNDGNEYQEDGSRFMPDDSTLTKETAELFSQAVEYSNFMESRPNLSYKEYIGRVIDSGQDATITSDWFNALTGRIFFDVFSQNFWSIWFKRKIQRKLYRIRLPYFMETLTLTKIDLGSNAPHFLNVVSHSFDSFGLSIDFDMSYSGGLTMTFETKLNLLKIKSDNSSNASSASSHLNVSSNSSSPSQTASQPSDSSIKDSSSFVEAHLESNTYKEGNKSSLSSSGSTRTSGESSDSDESDSDSSSDSSLEADVDEISDWEDYGAEKTRQSIVRFVDKIASSRYFQHATENRYIKKKLQDISNCPLVLIVKIQSLNGILTLNVPPPQTDRIWYGFKPQPELTLKALPKMGDREVNLSHVTDWIERKLAEEFRKILVIPNMEDIVLPVLKSDHLLYVTTTK